LTIADSRAKRTRVRRNRRYIETLMFVTQSSNSAINRFSFR
jgi:hypothetical protein